ncbi:MAG: hypothetical protein ACPG7F_06490 [Aggregatilineales bacterium]
MRFIKPFLLIFFISLMGFSAIVQAQFQIPPQVLEASIQATQTALPELGRPDRWDFQQLAPTDDSSMGCSLVTGTTLPAPVTPFRVVLYYNDVGYTVYTSTDGTRTQLCDEKFGDAMAAPQTVSPTGCIFTAISDGTLASNPDINSAIAGATFIGGASLEGFGRSADSAWYQVRTDTGTGWVQAAAVTPGTGCDSLPITASLSTDAGADACLITPTGNFSNVRSQPNTDAPQVDTIFENSVWEVLGQNSAGTWYFIQSGWVAISVSTVSGNCSTVPVQDGLVGTGGTGNTTEGTTGQIATEYTCPLGFEGFLAPGIKIGAATAQVANNGTPNTLRSQPVANDSIGERLGTIQPGRTLDTVLNGPACSDGFVWWFVEIDGATGWTAESDVSNRQYFLIPTTGNELTSAVTTTSTPVPTAEPATPVPAIVVTATPVSVAQVAPTEVIAPVDDTAPSVLSGVRILQTGVAVREVLLSPDETLVYVLSGDGLGIQVWNISQGLPTGQSLAADSAVFDMQFVNGQLMTLHLDNSLRTWDGNFAELSRVPDVGAAFFDVTGDAAILAKGGCFEGDAAGCTTGSVEVRNMGDGALLRGQPAHPAAPIQVIVSPDNTRLASSSVDGVQVWELQSGAFVNAFGKDPQQPINRIAFSPDSSQLLWGSCAATSVNDANQVVCTQGDVRLFDIASGETRITRNDHTGNVFSVTFDPTGTRFATAGSDSDVHLVDAISGETIALFSEHSGNVNSLDFSAAGTLLVSGGDDGLVILWQFATP